MLGNEDGLPHVHSRHLFIDDSRPIANPNDGCHPNDAGYIQIARYAFLVNYTASIFNYNVLFFRTIHSELIRTNFKK